MKAILFQLTACALLFISSTLAVEFIDLNDHNNDLLPLEIGKSLKIVQNAMQNEYKFESFDEVLKFLNRCKYLIESIKTTNDADFEGLSGKIKTIVQEPEFTKLCSVDENELKNKFGLLGAKDMGIQVTLKRLNDLIKLGDMDLSYDSNKLLKHLYEKSKLATSENLLKHAAEDTTVFFGEEKKSGKFLDLKTIYNTGCEISSLKAICKLVRKSNVNDIQAFGSDVADFRAILESKDQPKLDEHINGSGVGLDELKATCLDVIDNFHAFRIVDKYVEAGFINTGMIDEQCKSEPNFYLYNEIHKLCKSVVATSV